MDIFIEYFYPYFIKELVQFNRLVRVQSKVLNLGTVLACDCWVDIGEGGWKKGIKNDLYGDNAHTVMTHHIDASSSCHTATTERLL